MKKFLSILLAVMLLLSVSSVAMAVDGDDTNQPSGGQSQPTYSDFKTVTVTKVYKLTNSGTTSPEETFTLEQVGNGKVTSGDATSAPALGTITGAYFAEGAATTNGATATITIPLPDYEKVGVYEYVLQEKIPTTPTAGVTYRPTTETIKLVVTVINDATTGKLRVAAVHTEANPKSGSYGVAPKSDRIENTFSAGKLEISKTVTGNLGDKEKYFEFKVTLTGESVKAYADSYAVSGGSYGQNPTTIALGRETTFQLKHGDTITIANLPYGVTYTVTETGTTSSEVDNKTVYKNGDYTVTMTGDSGTVNSASQTAAFTNTKEGDVDTGVSLDSLPYLLMLAVVGAGLVLMIARKRRVQD